MGLSHARVIVEKNPSSFLSDILQKEQVFRNEEEHNEANDGHLTDINEEEETASESSQPEEAQETKKNDDSESEEEADIGDSENTVFIKAKVVNLCQHSEGQNVYDTAVMKCTKCFWLDNHKICPICNHKIPLDQKHGEHSLRQCYDCGAITHKNEKTSKVTYYPPSNEDDEDDYQTVLYSTSKIEVVLDILYVCLVLMLLMQQFAFVLAIIYFQGDRSVYIFFVCE